MSLRIYEVLDIINNDITATLNYKSDTALKLILKNSFDTEMKWDLPETVPPYKVAVEPSDMAPSNLRLEARAFYLFRRKDLKPIKREQLFIQMLERLDQKEQKILLAMKNQSITNLYPNITKESVSTLLNA